MAKFNKNKWVYISGILVVAGMFYSFFIYDPFKIESNVLKDEKKNEDDESQSEDHDDPAPETEQKLYIDIKGEVHQPGVYLVEKDMRVIDVVELAGGLLNEAALDQVNLAERVFDEMVIYVPNIEDVESIEKLDHLNASNHAKMKINRATLEELIQLPGIGEKKAEAIIQSIAELGPFETVDDLTRVSGIGEKTVESLKDLITIP